MSCRPTLRPILLIAIGAMLYVPAIHAQLPQRIDKCVSHPTLAEEIQKAQSPTVKGSSLPKVRIAAVTFEGADHLLESVKAQTIRQMEESNYDHDSKWMESAQETVRDAVRERGYPYAEVSAKTSVLSRDLKEERVAVTFQVSEGRQYRLSEIQFANARVFPPSELRKHIPLVDGDVFNLVGLRKGMEALTWLYATQGYINFTVSPDIQPDNENQRISVRLELEEDRQFRVGSVQVLGLDRPLSGPTLKTKLVPGQVFNSALIEDVFKENKSVLPADVSWRDDTRITQDARKDTVAIVFYFMPCL